MNAIFGTNTGTTRRAITLIIAIVLSVYATDYVEYHRTLRDQLLTAKTFTVFVLAIASLAALLWSLLKPNPGKTLVSFALGIGVATLGNEVIKENVVFFTLVLVGLIVITMMNLAVKLPFGGMFKINRVAIRRPASNP